MIFTRILAETIYGFLSSHPNKGNLYPGAPDKLGDEARSSDVVITPNQIPSDRAQEAILYILDNIFSLEGVSKDKSDSRIYNIYDSDNKKSFRFKVTHTFFRVEIKSKRPNATKSNQKKGPSYQTHWVPIRALKKEGSWVLIEPPEDQVVVNKVQGVETVEIINSNSPDWDRAVEIGKVSLIRLAKVLRSSCSEILTSDDSDADSVFRNSEFCSYFILIKKILESATGVVLLPYLVRDVKTVEIKVEDNRSQGLLKSLGLYLTSDILVSIPVKFSPLYAAQYADYNQLVDLISKEWNEASDKKLENLLNAYRNVKPSTVPNETTAIKPPLLQQLIPSTNISFSIEDRNLGHNVDLFWKYSSYNRGLLFVGSSMHDLYNVYGEVSLDDFLLNDFTPTEIANNIAKIEMKDTPVSLSFITTLTTKGYLLVLNSVYINNELVSETLDVNAAEVIFSEDDFKLTDAVGYKTSTKLFGILSSILKVVRISGLGDLSSSRKEIYYNDTLETNVPKNRLSLILDDTIEKLGYSKQPVEGGITKIVLEDKN